MTETTETLRKFIAERNMTQAQLSQELGYSVVYIRKVFAGMEPISDGLKWKFAQCFGHETAQAVFQNGDYEGQQ